MNLFQFKTIKSTTILKADWIEPVLRDFVISFDMDVMRFIAITGIKKIDMGQP
jgi:hypothetical protein